MNNLIFTIANTFPTWLILLLVALAVVIGDTLAKYWSINQKYWLVILLILCYLISAFLYLPSLLKEKLAITTVIWSVFMMIGSIFVGLLLFKETITLKQAIGIVLGIISLLLVNG